MKAIHSSITPSIVSLKTLESASETRSVIVNRQAEIKFSLTIVQKLWAAIGFIISPPFTISEEHTTDWKAEARKAIEAVEVVGPLLRHHYFDKSVTMTRSDVSKLIALLDLYIFALQNFSEEEVALALQLDQPAGTSFETIILNEFIEIRLFKLELREWLVEVIPA